MDFILDRPALFMAVVFVLVMVPTIILSIKSENKWVDWCEAQGGHKLSRTKMNPGFTTGGDIAFTTSTLTVCLSEDGRILDVR